LAILAVGMTALAACTSADPGESTDMAMSTDAPDLQARLDLLRPRDLWWPASDRLRLVTGNLTTGNGQSYEQPGIRIFRALAADVAMVQELNAGSNSTAELRAFVDDAFGPEYMLARALASGKIPNGIVSRYPILASGEWTDTQVADRDFVWAQIDIPGPIDLYAISVHLLGTGTGPRDLEAGELVQHIQGFPAGAYVVLGGDFNTSTRSEPCVQTLSSVLMTSGPFPVDQGNVENTNANRNKPYDWVLVNGPLAAQERSVAIGGNMFAHGLVVDTRVYSPIADLAPALSGDSGASNMQHMAVVRDFALPVPPSGD
jgi:endonuclease/exonuclease/phosphatase family metal-dependent hydrolase